MATILASVLFLETNAFAVPIPFEMVPLNPLTTSSLTVTFSAGLFGSSTDSSTVSGTATVDLIPGTTPFTTAQVTGLDLMLDDALSFRLLGGIVKANVAAGELMISMLQPGPTAIVNRGIFDQPGNTFVAQGTVQTNVQGNIELSTLGPQVVDLENFSLSQVHNQITIEVPIEIVQDTVIENLPFFGDVPVTITTTGMIQALGTAVPGLGNMQWDGNTPGAGVPGDGSNWGHALNWSREGIADQSFVTGDNVTFPAGSGLSVIYLQGDRLVNRIRFERNYTLHNNTLTVATGEVITDEAATVTVHSELASNTGSIAKLGPGTLLVNGSAPNMNIENGTLGGHGSVNRIVSLPGTVISPGDKSTGTLQVNNPLTQPPGATLKIKVKGSPSGSEYDQLNIAGRATLKGTLAIQTLTPPTTGVTPGAVGDTLTFITFSSLEGEFDAITGRHAGSGVFYDLLVHDHHMELGAWQAKAGDIDGDRDIDVTDFYHLSTNFSPNGNDTIWTMGNFSTDDGDVDITDFNLLATNFSPHGYASHTDSITVPEPPTAILLVTILLLAALRIQWNITSA